MSQILSEKEKQSIEELRSRLSDELKEVPSYSDDYSLLRWLIGWDYNIEAIVPKLKYLLTTLSALKLHEADFSSIDKVNHYVTDISKAARYCPGGIAGYDKEGNVVMVQPMGRSDPKTLLSTCRLSEMLKIGISESEGVMSLIRANEERLNQKLGTVIICDLEGFSLDLLWMPGMKFYMLLLQTLQAMYPDIIKKIYVIRAPQAIHTAYNMVYHVLSKENRDKVEFLSANWQEKLQEVISPDQLFEYWGGTHQAATPFGNIRMGGKVPTELRYDANLSPLDCTSEQLSTLSVPARFSKTVVVKVDLSGSRLQWFFRVSSGDVNFSIVHSSGKVMQPVFLLNTEFVPEWGEVTCELPGEYTLTFDNSHGKLWSKEIKYRVQVLVPDVS
uniref:CRAL-TRIO domain-containing protein n=1 Tax=Plectus sambesii TaxID=2011161 RepID=A0A914VIE6_9BILA